MVQEEEEEEEEEQEEEDEEEEEEEKEEEEEEEEEVEEEEEKEPLLVPPPPSSRASKLLSSKLKKASPQVDVKNEKESLPGNRPRALSPAVAKRFMQHALGVRIETHDSLGLHSKTTGAVAAKGKGVAKSLTQPKAPMSSVSLASSTLSRGKASLSSSIRKIRNLEQKYLLLHEQPMYKPYVPNPATDGTCQSMCPTAHMSPAEVSDFVYTHLTVFIIITSLLSMRFF